MGKNTVRDVTYKWLLHAQASLATWGLACTVFIFKGELFWRRDKPLSTWRWQCLNTRRSPESASPGAWQ